MKISVIGPMRGRFDGAKRGIDSLINQAHNIDDVEFIFRFDDDDMDTVDKLREYYVDKNIDITFLVGERFGYCNMHKYWNQCTMESKGEYSLIGCTVSPPFDYKDFELASPEWNPKNFNQDL